MAVEFEQNGIFVMHRLPIVQQLMGRMEQIANVSTEQRQMGMGTLMWIASHNIDPTQPTQPQDQNQNISPDWALAAHYAATYVHKPALCTPFRTLTNQGIELYPHCKNILEKILDIDPRLADPENWHQADEMILLGFIKLRPLRLLSVMYNALEDAKEISRIERWDEIQKEMDARRALITDEEDKMIQGMNDHSKTMKALQAAQRLGVVDSEGNFITQQPTPTHTPTTRDSNDQDQPDPTPIMPTVPPNPNKSREVTRIRSGYTAIMDLVGYDPSNVQVEIQRNVLVDDIGVTDFPFIRVGSLPKGTGKRDIDELVRYGLVTLRRMDSNGRGRPGTAATVSQNGKRFLTNLRQRGVLPADFSIRNTVDF